MQSRTRIKKRDAAGNTNGLSANEIEKDRSAAEREMANAVKSWVAEWEARNSALKTAAASLIRSLEDSRPNPTPQFRFNHRRTDYLFGKPLPEF